MKSIFKIVARSGLVFGTSSLVFLGGCASGSGGELNLSALKGQIPAEKLMAVDCLLPPQVRKLGSQATFLTVRRPTKITALDCEIRGGEYVAHDRADYRTSLMVWLEQAKLGSPEAQTYVGEIYEKGLGLPADYHTAHTWYKKAAEQGFSRAQINLGYLYEKGLGVSKNKITALNWYRLASGVTDDIDYSSSLEVRADVLAEQKTAPLREQLAVSESRVSQLQTSLSSTRSQLANSRRLLKSSQNQIHTLQKTIQTERARGADTSALEERYKVKLALLKSQEVDITKLESKVLQTQGKLSKPVIEVTDPPLLPTRSGEPVLQVRPGGRAQVIKGRINAPAGLKQATLNGKVLSTDQQGYFNSAVSIPKQEVTVTIQATDNKNLTSQFAFKVVPSYVSASAEPERALGTRVSGDVNLGRYYALVIGNNEYKNYPRLETASRDAGRVAEVLKSRYGFKTRVIKNADRYTMLSAVNEIKAKLRPEDNLLIYYAGHGEIDQRTQRGYWLPVDAEQGNTANWIANSAISDLLNTITARHVLVVADSCYSGSMSGTSIARLNTKMDETRLEKWLETMARTKSRTVLTSGGLGPALDSIGGEHSVFAKAFIEHLESNQGVLDAYRLYLDLSTTVRSRAEAVGFRQVPTYAPIRHAGHGGGEFVMVKR